MRNGTIVCKCGHTKRDHALWPNRCHNASRYIDGEIDPCKCRKYRPFRVKVVWVGITAYDRAYAVEGVKRHIKHYEKHLSLTWHRVEVLVPITTKKTRSRLCKKKSQRL